MNNLITLYTTARRPGLPVGCLWTILITLYTLKQAELGKPGWNILCAYKAAIYMDFKFERQEHACKVSRVSPGNKWYVNSYNEMT